MHAKSIKEIARDLKIILAEYGSPDPSFGGGMVFLRARDSVAPQTRSLEG
jgi:hypothetical protein